MPGCCALNVVLPTAGSGAAPPQAPVDGSAGCPAWVAVNLLLLVAASHGSSGHASAAFRPLRHAGRGIRCRRDVREVTAAATRAAGRREQWCGLPVLRRPGGRCRG